MKAKILMVFILVIGNFSVAQADDISNCAYGYQDDFNVTTKVHTQTCLPYHEPLPTVIKAPEVSDTEVVNGNIVLRPENLITYNHNVTSLNNVQETVTAQANTVTLSVDSATVTTLNSPLEIYATIQALLKKIYELIALLGIKG